MSSITIIYSSQLEDKYVKAIEHVLDFFEINYTTYEFKDNVVSTLDYESIDIVIVIAGLLPALAQLIARQTLSPVIAVPIKNKSLQIDNSAPFAYIECGVPVAYVGFNAVIDAAIIALQIIAVRDDALRNKLKYYFYGIEYFKRNECVDA